MENSLKMQLGGLFLPDHHRSYWRFIKLTGYSIGYDKRITKSYEPLL